MINKNEYAWAEKELEKRYVLKEKLNTLLSEIFV